nr:reverse transcriptase domain-containing protein [Tanacetum cinerariifolium]
MRPPGFAQPNVQNNQNRFGQPQGFNRSLTFNQEQPYQATQSNQNFHLNELEKIKRMNDVGLKAMQNQIVMVKNEIRNEMKTSIQTSLSNQTNEIKNMMASLLQMNTASTSGSGSLPGNTIANPKGELKAITTRSGLAIEGPIIPNPPKSVNPEEDECVEETYTDPDHADELKCKALADLGASINLMPLSVWKKLGLPDLIPTQMTLELANYAICTPDRIARDVFVPVGKFTFPADFVVVDYEGDHRVPIILGRPFLRTARALIDVYDEEMILRDGDERLTLNMKHDTASYSNHPYRDSNNLINIFNLSSEDCLEDFVSNKQSGNPTFSLHEEIASPEVIPKIHDSKGCTFLSEELPDIDSFNDIHSHFDDDPLKMFTDEQPHDYSFPPRFDVYPDDFLEIESDANFNDDSFGSEGEKIKEAELLIDPLDLPCDILFDHGQNPHLAYQAPGYQAPVYQALIPQPQVVTTTEFTNYMKANDSILKNMQTNMTSLSYSNFELKNMFGQFMKMNTASSSGSEPLPSNTITNPKEDLKGITTRSGNAYKGPTIPTTSSLPKVVESETEPVVAPVVEPVEAPVSALKPNPKLSIPYSSRLHDQKLCDKANDQKEKFFQIFQDLNFNISFVDALILMPNFGLTIKKKLGDPGKFLNPCDFPGMDECFALADLGASINLMPLSMWNKLSLLELSPTCMTLELADRSISHPVGVAEDVFVKLGTFHFLTDFVVVDFDADPRVLLILGRSFLKTGRALIDVYEGELTLRVGNKAITFNLDQTRRYSVNYDDMSVNRIDLIDVACEEYSQEVLGFFMSGNPTLSTKPIVSNSSPTLTPFGDSDFLLEKTDALLAIDDVPISPEIDESYYDSEGDILLLEEFLNDDPSLPPLLPQELKVVEPTNEKLSIDKPPMVKLKDLPPHLEYEFLKGDDKLLVIIAKDLEDEAKTALIKVLKSHKQALAWIDVDKAKVDVIAKLPHPTTVKGIRSFLGHAGFYRRFIQYFLKIARPMTRLLEKDTPFFFSKECVEAFQTLKKKLTKAPILVAPDWDLPFELMCDASEFAIGVVPGQRKTKHFQPIHYASKTMTNAQAHYTTTEKELLAVVYTFEKFRPYLVLSKSIVYTDHSALKYLFNKQDAKPRLRRWVLLLKEIDIIVRDKKRAENLAADHISPLENPHQSVLDKKEINEMFPLETLNMVSFRGDSSTSCITFETTPSCSKFVRIKSSGGVFTGKPLIFSRLTTMDLPGDIMAQTTSPKRENFSNEMKCLKIPSKCVKFLTYGASISWGRSCLHEGTSIYSWMSITCRNGLKRKRSPPTTPELFANS